MCTRNRSSQNLYEILGEPENTTYENLKKSYQKLIRIHHPDKQLNQTDDHFVAIQNAWEILSDTGKRKEYDAELLQNRLSQQTNIYSKLSLQEMEYNDEDETYNYQCRCGGSYIVTKEDLQENDTLVECDECSLSIHVTKNKI